MSDKNGEVPVVEPWQHQTVEEIESRGAGRPGKDDYPKLVDRTNRIIRLLKKAQSHIAHIEEAFFAMVRMHVIDRARIKGLEREVTELRREMAKDHGNGNGHQSHGANVDYAPSIFPKDLSLVREFQKAVLGENVKFTRKTLTAFERSDYRRPQEVFIALLALNALSHAEQAKRCGDKAAEKRHRTHFQSLLESANLRLSNSATMANARRYDSDYFENMGNPKEKFFDQHLRHGGKHDPKATLAIYFRIEDDGTILVGGRGTEHLKNSMS